MKNLDLEEEKMFENFRTFETTYAGRPVKVETGKTCGLANGSCWVRYGETVVMANVTASAKPREGVDFFPLSVDFEEKMYAVGKIPGSFTKREGKASDKAILASRCVDRPIRPLFPKDMRNDVTVVITVLSVDPDNSPEIAGMIAASIAISISIIFTILMMVFEPMIIKASGMTQLMGGALIGGTVDSTGAVVLAGNALGPEAEQAAVLVKSIQNILIGFIAFFVAVFFATRVDKNSDKKVGAGEIWNRFPKFILGFFAASLIASFIIQPLCGSGAVKEINGVLDQYKNWAFVLAFTSIGLDTNFKEIAKQMQGGKVLWLYIIGQTFNIALTFFAIPVLDLYK